MGDMTSVKKVTGERVVHQGRQKQMPEGKRTGMDVANAVRDMIKAEFPNFNEADAMRLAVGLTKNIDKIEE